VTQSQLIQKPLHVSQTATPTPRTFADDITIALAIPANKKVIPFDFSRSVLFPENAHEMGGRD